MFASTLANLPKEGKTNESFATSMRELIEAATKLAQLDEAYQHAQENEPPINNDQARLWHDVSMKTLLWTRTVFTEQQSNALKQLQLSVATQISQPESPAELDILANPWEAKPVGIDVMTSHPDVAVTPAVAGQETDMGQSFEKVGSLRNDFDKLKEYPPDRCLIVRRIKRLGISSPELLRQRFEQFGSVTEVFAAHSAEKRGKDGSRVRPAAIGFIVMGSDAEANAALAAGPAILIGDADITVQPFASFSS